MTWLREPRGRRRELFIAWLHLAVLWAFAFAQPLFEILADSPEFFVARGNTGADILVLAFGLVLVPPTLLLAVELVLLRAEPLRRLVHLVFVGALAGALALQLLKSVADGPAPVLLVLALACGAGVGLAYDRVEGVRTALTLLAPAPVLFLVLFLASPVSELFQSDDDVRVREDVRPGAPVVMVVLDEFSVELLMDANRRIDATRFPNFAALAESGTWYRNATTISDHTTDAVPGLLSARYPTSDSLPIASDYPRSLFTLLGGAYSLRNVDEPATDLCPERLCGERSRPPADERLVSLGKDLTVVSLHKLLPNALANRLPAVDTAFGGFTDQGPDVGGTSPPGGGEVAVPERAFDDRPGQLERLAEGLDADGGAPTLSFLHVLLPHTPWQYLPNGQQYLTGTDELPGIQGGTWPANPAPGQLAYQRTSLQAGYVDRLLGRLVRRLRSEGVYDRTLFVLAADHGISFRPGTSRRSAVGESAPDVFGVPLFIKTPGQERGRVDDGRATTADVLPTVADALGIDLRWRTDGSSLLAPARSTAPVSVSVFPSRKRRSMSLEEYARGRDAEVARMQERLGDAPGWDAVYALGPDADLFGDEVGPLRSDPLGGAEASFEDTDSFDSVDPDGAVVPAFVRARLAGPVSAGQRLAVAVNGVVRGVSLAYDSNGQVRLGAMVPPTAFRRGDNEVEVYAISGRGASRRLALIGRPG